MRITTPLYFAGSHRSSRTGTPEPSETGSSTPDSVHTDASTEHHIAISRNTAKELLKNKVITQAQYELLTGGLDKAHAEIQNKINLARTWQTKSADTTEEMLDKWDELEQTEVQLDAVRNSLLGHQHALMKMQHQKNAIIVENMSLRQKLIQQQSQSNKKKETSVNKPTEALLRQFVLTSNAYAADSTESANELIMPTAE